MTLRSARTACAVSRTPSSRSSSSPRLGRAAVRVLGAEQPYVVGRDTRRSGPMLEAALVAGMCAEGADVILAGVLPTPGVAYLAHERAAAAAVISASHNSYEDNGVKLFAPGGRKISEPLEARVERRAGRPGRVDARRGAERHRRRDRVRVPGRARRLRRAPHRVARGPADRRHARRSSTAATAPRSEPRPRRCVLWAPTSRCCTPHRTARTSTTRAVRRTPRSCARRSPRPGRRSAWRSTATPTA